MADDICLGCGLGLDAGKRLEVRVDGTTILCADDGTGTGSTHLVATGANVPLWPYTCGPAAAAYKVYKDVTGALVAGPRPWTTVEYFVDSAPVSDINTRLQSNSVVLRQVGTEIYNNEPCGRDICVNIDFVFGGFGINIPAYTKLALHAEFTLNGGLNWTAFAGYGFDNNTAADVFFATGGSPWLISFQMLAGSASRWCGMRWMTHPQAASHTPGRAYNTAPHSVYSTEMKIEKTTLCNGWGT